MRLIDADELKKTIEVAIKDSGFYKPIYQGFAKAIDVAPIIDAESVRHGHWIDGTCGSYKICSECDQISDFDFDYCPNCGAKMDEVSE